jgi:adenosylcobinamide kinase / adenosylcobinamide-phosphate guanylyltransferase
VTRTLVLGGARSGKSSHAEQLLAADGPVRYLATARRDPHDAEWSARLETHQRRRPPGWSTVEDPDVAGLVRAGGGPLLVDDLATWLTRVLDDAGAWEADRVPAVVGERVAELVAAVRAAPGRVLLVSAEVGLGVVPPTRSGRMFRDELGSLNSALAEVCDEVLLLVAGLPVRLK